MSMSSLGQKSFSALFLSGLSRWAAGLFCLSLVAAFSLKTNCSAAVSLVDPGFEDRPDGTTFGGTLTFASTGIWTLDNGSYRTARNGITPFEGAQMLSFDATGQASTDIYQLVDVSSYSNQIAAGTLTFTLSAYFNAPAIHSFSLEMLAYFETTTPLNSSAYDGIAFLGFTNLDANPATWQQLSLTYKPPVGTHFVAFGLNSMIDGHVSYADTVEITVVPEPCPAALLMAALVLFCYHYRSRVFRQHHR